MSDIKAVINSEVSDHDESNGEDAGLCIPN